MNHPIRRSLPVLSLTAAILALAAITSLAQPPRGAESLTAISSGQGLTGTAGQGPGTMSCTACDTKLTRSTDASRGQRFASQTASHGCGDCTTTFKTTGHGKAKTQTATHNCTMAAKEKAGCCASSRQ